MRWVGWYLLVSVVFMMIAAGPVSGFEGDLTIDSVEHPGTGAVLPGGRVNVSVYLHDAGLPVEDSFTLYIRFPDGSYLPEGTLMLTDADGWKNVSVPFVSPYSGDYIFSICDPDLQTGWGGGSGFFLDSAPIDLLGISTDRQCYRAGDPVWYSVVNDPLVTNVSDVGTLEVFGAGDLFIGEIGEDASGGFELGTDIDPGIYTIRSETGGLEGTFAVSDIEVFPRNDIYHFGETINVTTRIAETMSASLISPDGSIEYTTISGPTDIVLPATGSPGSYSLIVTLDGNTTFREVLYVSHSDLWADTKMEVYEPGSLVKMYFSARDIGLGLDGFEEFEWDIIYNTVSGPVKVDDGHDDTSGTDTFTTRADVVYGRPLWDTGTDNRIDLYLNISSGTVRRTIPLTFGQPTISIEGGPRFGTNEEIELTIVTELRGQRPLWTIRTADGDVVSHEPPVKIGTDPFGRDLMRIDDLIYVAESVDYSIETVAAPMPGVDITVHLKDMITDITTDGSGSAVLRSGPLEEGEYTIAVNGTHDEMPDATYMIIVSEEALDIGIDGPAVAFAGETVDYDVNVTSGGSLVAAEIDYVITFGEILIAAGATDGDITFTMPDAVGDVHVACSAAVDGITVFASLDVTLVGGEVYLGLGNGSVTAGSAFTVLYSTAFATGGTNISYMVEGIDSGTLSTSDGAFLVEVPEVWTDGEVRVSVRAYDAGRVFSATLVLPLEGTANLAFPDDPKTGPTAISYSMAPPRSEGVFISGTIAMIDRNGAVIAQVSLNTATGTVIIDLAEGISTLELTASYLTSGGIERIVHTEPIQVAGDAPDDEEKDEFELSLYLALVLILVIIGLVIALAGSQRKIREMKAKSAVHDKKVGKLKKKLKSLEDMLPSEEGHRIRREKVPDEEEEVEEEPDEEPEEPATPAPKPMKDDKTWAVEAPCPMCGDAVYIPAKRPATVRCADCSFEFIVE
jgi:hypothetical protein